MRILQIVFIFHFKYLINHENQAIENIDHHQSSIESELSKAVVQRRFSTFS